MYKVCSPNLTIHITNKTSTMVPHTRLGPKSCMTFIFLFWPTGGRAQFPNPICMFSGWKQLQINLGGVTDWLVGDSRTDFLSKCPLSQMHPKKTSSDRRCVKNLETQNHEGSLSKILEHTCQGY